MNILEELNAIPVTTDKKTTLIICVDGEDQVDCVTANCSKTYCLDIPEQKETAQKIIQLIAENKKHMIDTFIDVDDPPKWYREMDKYGLIPYIDYGCNAISEINLYVQEDNIYTHVSIC